VFVNDDSRLDRGCIDRLIHRVASEPDIGAVGGRIRFADGLLQEAGGIIWSDGTTAHVGRDLPAGDPSYLVARDVDYCSANGLLVTRSAWEAADGFDESYYPAYYEDVDLCMTLRRLGLRTVYEPTATLRHLETQSSSSSYRRFLMDRNRATFVARWGAALVGYDAAPTVDRRGAIDRRVGRSRILVPLDPESPSDAGGPLAVQSTGPAGSGHAERSPSAGDPEMPDRELRHARYAIEVKDAYIAMLTEELREGAEREAHRTRGRRWARTTGARLRAAVPPGAKAWIRSVRGQR
jgi:hypothetical protein